MTSAMYKYWARWNYRDDGYIRSERALWMIFHVNPVSKNYGACWASWYVRYCSMPLKSFVTHAICINKRDRFITASCPRHWWCGLIQTLWEPYSFGGDWHVILTSMIECQYVAKSIVMRCCKEENEPTWPLEWRHNGTDGLSKHLCLDCLLSRLFRRRSQKTSKLRVTGLCKGNLPVIKKGQ